MKEDTVYALANLLITMPTYEEFSREQENAFMIFVKKFTESSSEFQTFWKKSQVRLCIMAITVKAASVCTSKRSILSYVQLFNKWFTQDSSGKQDFDIEHSKLEYWELFSYYLVSKRFFCVEPMEDFEITEHKDDPSFEMYIYWDVAKSH